MIARRRRPPRRRGRPNGEGIAGWTVAPHPPRRCTPGFTRRTAATTRPAPAAAATPAPPRHGTARNAPTPAGDGAGCAGRSNSGCRSRSGSPSAITAASTAASAAGSGPWRHGHRSPVMLEVYAREHAPLVGDAVTRLGLGVVHRLVRRHRAPDLPADPPTVIEFLADCPADRKTHCGSVDAIDHRHTEAGHPHGRSRPRSAREVVITGRQDRSIRAGHPSIRCSRAAPRNGQP